MPNQIRNKSGAGEGLCPAAPPLLRRGCVASETNSILGGPGEGERAETDRRYAAETGIETVGEAIDPLQEKIFLQRDRRAERLVVGLGEAEVADRERDLAVLDGEDTVPGHPGDDRPQRVHPPRVPEPRDQETALDAADELLARGGSGFESQVQRIRIRLAGEVRVPGVAGLVPRRGLRVVHHRARRTALDERDALGTRTLEVESLRQAVAVE